MPTHPTRHSHCAPRLGHAFGRGREHPARAIFLAIGGMVWATLADPALAQVPTAWAPSPPTAIAAAKAYAMLERNCARCHQSGRLTTPTSGGDIANLLALDEVALDLNLVRPGIPDASRIYSIAMTRERHLDAFNDPAEPEPTPTELQALRDWIAELPPRALGACARRPTLTAEQLKTRIKTALEGYAPEAARQTRFLSLAGLYNDCATWADLDGLRQGLRRMLAAQVPDGQPIPDAAWPPAIDPEQLILALPLNAIGWSAENWDRLAARYPLRHALALPRPILEATGTPTPVLPADWLAATLLDRQTAAAPHMPKAGEQPGPFVWGLPAAQALRHAWTRPAGFNRAAADIWLEPAELAERLARAPFDTALPARQLRSGGVARRHLLVPLLSALTGDATASSSTNGDPDSAQPDIALWMKADTYRSGDLAIFNIATSDTCHLTLVNVDRSGRATVLFPNEFEPDNLIEAGRPVKVPAPDAPYHFRFKEKGRETAIAICSTTHKAPTGVLHDYERLRFTTLGDWQLFLREPPATRDARRDDAATDSPRPEANRRRRNRARDPVKPGHAPPIADVQTRTAITIDVE